MNYKINTLQASAHKPGVLASTITCDSISVDSAHDASEKLFDLELKLRSQGMTVLNAVHVDRYGTHYNMGPIIQNKRRFHGKVTINPSVDWIIKFLSKMIKQDNPKVVGDIYGGNHHLTGSKPMFGKGRVMLSYSSGLGTFISNYIQEKVPVTSSEMIVVLGFLLDDTNHPEDDMEVDAVLNVFEYHEILKRITKREA